MAAVEFIRYALDPTGTSSNNLVVGEVRNLQPGAIRAAAPKYGPFFTESMVIYDNDTNRLLIRGQDYELVDLVQEATLSYAKEIMAIILVKNAAINALRITYQLLGGLYQNNSEGIIELYNALLNDGRGVDWSNIFNKPLDYPSSPHLHDIMDIYGFGPVVVALERIRDAIVLSNIPAFESLVNWVKAYAGSSVMFDPVVQSLERNDTQAFNIQTSNQPNGTKLYWTIETVIGNTSFVAMNGEFTLFQNRGNFQIALSNIAPEEDTLFNIAIRQGNINGGIVTTIEGITYVGVPVIPPEPPSGEKSIFDLMNECCLYDPGVKIDALSLYIIGGR